MKTSLTFLAVMAVLPFAASAQPQADTMSPAVKHEVKKAEKMDRPLNDAQILAIVENADKGEVERVHETSCDGPELNILRCEICHPRIPQSLRRVCGAEKIKCEKVSSIRSRMGNEDSAADYECNADAH